MATSGIGSPDLTAAGLRLVVPSDSWYSPKIAVRPSPLHGLGTFALERIEQDEVVEIWGERTDGRLTVIYTSDRRAVETARSEGKAVMQWDDDLFSIEEKGADEGYFLNHSCDANLWLRDAFTLVARRPIEPYQELTIDYALFESEPSLIAISLCLCNSAVCRGMVTGRDWQNVDLQVRYAGHFSPLIEKLIARTRSG